MVFLFTNKFIQNYIFRTELSKLMKSAFLKSNFFKALASILLTALSLFFIIKYIDFNLFLSNLKKIDPLYLVLGSFSLLVSYYFRVLRYEEILNLKGNKAKLFSVSAIHYFVNKALPAKTGELSLPILLKKHLDFNYKEGITALLFVRVLDFFAMLLLLLLASFYVETLYFNKLWISISTVVALLTLLLSWIFLDKVFTFLVQYLEKLNQGRLQKLSKKLSELFIFIKSYKSKTKHSTALKALLISVLNWVAIYFYYYFIIKSFHFSQSYLETVFASSISNFTFMLPINAVGNIGPFEGAWAIGFHLIGVDKDISVPIGLFSNIYATLYTAVLALIGFIILKYAAPFQHNNTTLKDETIKTH